MNNERYKKQDEQLLYHIGRLQQGYVESYNEIYNLSGKYLYKIIYDIVQDYHTTEDMLQETFMKIYNNINSLQNPQAYYVWAGRIATNLCVRYIHKYRKEILQTATDDGEGNEEFIFDTVADDNEMFIPESVLDNKEHQRLIGEVIERLSPEQKLAVQCFYFEEMSVKEIAELMGCSEGTIKSRLNYARKSIKEAVLHIEKTQGTKLYSLGGIPLLLLLYRGIAEGGVVTGASLAGATRTTTGVSTSTNAAATTNTMATSIAKSTTNAIGIIISAIVAAVAITGGILFLIFGIGNDDDNESTLEQEYGYEESYTEAESYNDVTEEITDDIQDVANRDIIPEGGKYVIAATGKELMEGERMPAVPQSDDCYYYGDYKYLSRGDYWRVELNAEDYETRTDFGNIMESVAGIPIEDISGLFFGCKSMIESPVIPSGTREMHMTYAYCESIIEPPVIPESVYSMDDTFIHCKSLVTPPNIPEGVIGLAGTFEDCVSLTEAPVIPEGVTNLTCTFWGCSSLKEAPVIHAGVEIMRFTFWGCTGLTGTVIIHANPMEYEECFNINDFESLNLEFAGSSTMLKELEATGKK